MSLGSSPPPAPNPAVTTALATQSNVGTGIAQNTMANPNIVGPYGTVTNTSAPSGISISDGNKGTIDIPQWTQTTTLSPQEQNLFDLNTAMRTNMGNIGVSESQKIGDLLGTPINVGPALDLSPGAVSGMLTDLGNKRLSPLLQQQWQQREADLFNRGIMPGMDQYKSEQDAFNRQRDDAYTQLVLNGYIPMANTMTTQHNSNVQDAVLPRNQTINELTALLSGSQLTAPPQIGFNPATVQPTNVAGITNQAYQDQLAAYGLQQQQNNAMMGGLFGLGSAALMAPMTGGTSLGGWGVSKILGR